MEERKEVICYRGSLGYTLTVRSCSGCLRAAAVRSACVLGWAGGGGGGGVVLLRFGALLCEDGPAGVGGGGGGGVVLIVAVDVDDAGVLCFVFGGAGGVVHVVRVGDVMIVGVDFDDFDYGIGVFVSCSPRNAEAV